MIRWGRKLLLKWGRAANRALPSGRPLAVLCCQARLLAGLSAPGGLQLSPALGGATNYALWSGRALIRAPWSGGIAGYALAASLIPGLPAGVKPQAVFSGWARLYAGLHSLVDCRLGSTAEGCHSLHPEDAQSYCSGSLVMRDRGCSVGQGYRMGCAAPHVLQSGGTEGCTPQLSRAANLLSFPSGVIERAP